MAVFAGLFAVTAVAGDLKNPMPVFASVVLMGGVVIVAALYVVGEVKKLLKSEKPTDKSDQS